MELALSKLQQVSNCAATPAVQTFASIGPAVIASREVVRLLTKANTFEFAEQTPAQGRILENARVTAGQVRDNLLRDEERTE